MRRAGGLLTRWWAASAFVLLASIGAACMPDALARAASWSAAAAAGVPNPPTGNKIFLWTVASQTATVHLLGSIHVGSRDLYPLDPRIETAFDNADTLVLEMPTDSATQRQAAQKLASAGTYGANDSIDLHVDRETLALLQVYVQSSGASFAQLRSFRPWLLALMVAMGEMQKLGYQPALGIDMYLARKAKGKRLLALETVDDQVALFSGMAEPVQESMLKETLAKIHELGEQMRRTLVLWRAGDAQALDSLTVAPLRAAYPDVYRTLFVDRNHEMAAAVEGYLNGAGHYFVVVGSGHLTGPEGVLDLLRARGYTPVQQ